MKDFLQLAENFNFRKQHSPEEWFIFWSNYFNNSSSISNFISQLKTDTDFFESPASTKYHGNYITGLVQHSSLVTEYFIKSILYYLPKSEHLSVHQYIIGGLFHDLCKVNTYEVDTKNVKNDSGVWVKEPFFKIKSNLQNLGHGVDSIWKLKNSCINYIAPEIYECIRWHMGTFETSKTDENDWRNAQKNNKLVILLELADRQATFWDNI